MRLCVAFDTLFKCCHLQSSSAKKQVKKAVPKRKRILAKWVVMIINNIFTIMVSLPQAIHHSQGISYIISFIYRKNSPPIIEKQ